MTLISGQSQVYQVSPVMFVFLGSVLIHYPQVLVMSPKSFKKTVYDSSKINTDTYIKWGLQAANNAASSSSSGKLGHEWTGTDNQGVKWHGYCNDKGEITSFYPED